MKLYVLDLHFETERSAILEKKELIMVYYTHHPA